VTGDGVVVVIADPYLGPVDHERALAGDRATVRVAKLDAPAAVAAATADADAVIVTTHPMTAELIGALGPGVRIIGRAGIGLDSIDLEAAAARGVAVFHTPDYCVDEVADQTLAGILMLQRRMLDQQAVAVRSLPGSSRSECSDWSTTRSPWTRRPASSVSTTSTSCSSARTSSRSTPR
jgi:lactate dehydrogenase-like 2-hydroxyacid dehydrogenase